MAAFKIVLKSLPLVLLTMTFGMVYFFDASILNLDRASLTRVYMLEFLAIHCFPFVMLLVFWHPTHDKELGLKWFCVCVLLLVYLTGAQTISGLLGVVELGLLIATTYFGFLLGTKSRREIPEVIFRGSLNLTLFILLSAIYGLPSKVNHWVGMESVLRAGLTYFLLLTVLELSGIYQAAWLRKNGERFKWEPEQTWKSQDPLRIRLKTAILPLLSSAGLGIAPYILLPIFVGFGARIIDDKVSWPQSLSVIQYWYLFATLLPLMLVRYWQYRLGGTVQQNLDRKLKRNRVILGGLVVLVFGSLGIYKYFDGGRIIFERFWLFDEIGIFFVPDLLLLFVLAPRAWSFTGNK